TAPDDFMSNTYIVKKGDSLYSIASLYNTTVTELKELNNLTNNTLQVGQILRVPSEEEEMPSENTYTVKAFNSNGVSRYFTDGVSTYYIATPKLSSASNSYGGIKVSWKKVSTATNYNIYRRKKGETYWENLGSVKSSKLSYLDTEVSSKKTYYYTVRAYDKNGVSEYDTTGVGTMYVPAPKVSEFKNTSKGVQISWKKVSVASSYRVYRKTEGGKWVLVKKLNNSKFTFTDTNVKSGVKYSYAVKAVCSGKLSGYTTKTIEYLKKPVVKSAKSTKSGVTITYSKSAGADKYRIYRKLNGEDEWTRIATVKGSSKVSYTDKTAKKGKTYRYTVRAFSGSYKSAYDNKTGYKIKDKY
ncbi:MAG: LysM peptidoglycan-binding domain-containing protein, partial [Acutalibacteraceae bacterium]|nr:LysM peptidoglycan-binding domain-containing protein [Acutalibacteraceae bacterium]